jgi:gliding motility-associated-like protein
MNKIITLLAFTFTLSFFNAQVFFENWDNPQAWMTNDADGDGFDWTPADLTGFGTPIDFLGSIVYSESWDSATGDVLFPDNYLISPAVDLSGLSGSLTLQFDVVAFEEDFFAENYSVYVVTDLADLGTATPVLSETLSDGFVVFNRTIDISSFAGQAQVFIVFRHHDCFDQFILIIDNIGVYHSDFSADILTGTTCAEYTFTDNSVGATDWAWDFGVGSNPATANTQGPHVVTYSTGGLKTISLTTNGVVTETKTDYLDINLAPDPTVDPIGDQTLCVGDMTTTIDFTGTGSGGPGLDFEWEYTTVPANVNIGLPFTGTGNIPSFQSVNPELTPVVATFTITPTDGACTGSPITFTITVNPLDNPTFSYAQLSYCMGSADELPDMVTTPGGTFSSTFGGFVDALTGQIAVSSFGVGTYDVTYTTNLNCPASSSLSIDIINLPTVDAVADFSVCEGGSSTAISFTGSGTTYEWSYTNPTTTNIGIASTGIGNIPVFTTTNGTGSDLTSTFTVIPFAGTCQGDPVDFDFTITIGGDDASFTYPATSFCQSDANPVATPVNLGGVFTVNSPDLIFNDAFGTIDLASSLTGTYEITYELTNVFCTTSSSFTITISSNISVDNPGNVTICENANTTDIIFTGAAGSNFSWTNDNINIGLAASGNGDILSFTALNGTTDPIVANITVTPSVGSCVGTDEIFTITVNPLDDAGFSYSDVSYCLSAANPTPTMSTAGTTGTFVASSGDLIINASTGEIDLVNSIAGNYSITFTSDVCMNDDIQQVVLIEIPTVNPMLDLSYCEGESTLEIQFTGSVGATFDWTNSNTDIGLAASGSGDIDPFTVTNGTLASIVSTIEVTPNDGMCLGNPIQFEFAVNTTSDASFTLSSTSVCSADGNPLTSITGSTGGIFSSSLGLVIDENIGAIDVANSDPGIYEIRYDVGSGTCASFSSLDFEIIESPTINPIFDVEVCSGQIIPNINLELLSTYTVEWTNDNTNTGISDSGTANIASFTAINPTLGALPEVSNITLVANNNGCLSNVESFTVTVNSNPLVNAGNDITQCSGNTLTMTATGTPGTIFIWDNNITQGETFTPNAGSYIYSVTGTLNGCSSIDQVNVLINLTPEVYAGEDRVVCAGSETVLTGSGAPFMTWNNGVFDNFPFIPSVSQSYTLTGQSLAGCSSTDEIFITVEQLPTPSFTADNVSTCSPATIIFNSSNTTNGCVYSFSDGTTEIGCFNVAHTFTGVGSYDVTLTQVSINQCVGSITLPSYITINPDPIASFNASRDLVDMIDPSVYFENTSVGAETYEWNFGDNLNVFSEENPTYHFPADEANDFTVRLIAISPFGCLDTAYRTIRVEESLIVYIPNSFTPNGDEFNNTFTPKFYSGVDPLTYNMKIFNRFGQLIFESNDLSIGWDGDFGAGRGYTNTAVYTYKIEFSTSTKDEKKLLVGNVNLLR